MILGANPYQRSAKRTNYRNGYRERKEPLVTGIGPVNISIPKLRKGSFYPTILEQYKRVDRALISIVSEAYAAQSTGCVMPRAKYQRQTNCGGCHY